MGVKRGNTVDSGPEVEISEEEAALYDRQIRLWGLDSQKRLRESKVLIIGLGGLAAEVSKNIALAGVKSITLLDSKLVEAKDFSAQFLIDPDSGLGKNRAEASEAAIRRLNPNVEVKSDTEDISVKEEDYFADYHVICATDCPPDFLLKINNICRKYSKKFFAGDVFGLDGYCFLDLGNHDYLAEVTKSVTKPTMEDEVEPPSKKSKVVEKVELVKKNLEFVSLEKALSVKFGKTGTGLRKKTSEVFFLVHILMKFREKHGRLPLSDKFTEDVEELKKIREEVMSGIGFDSGKVSDEMLSNVFGELSPVCAVVGGVLAQEIIKAVSEKDTPVQNFFLFNGDTCSGTTENIGR